MRIVFMGTPDFAVPSLEILVKNGYQIVGVVTAPDKPAGRGQQVTKSAVKEFAEKSNLRILQPANLKTEEFISELRSLKADLQIVVAFRMLPEAVWNMPPLGTYNVHASLLPDYRGAAPINWAIINGEKETGVTTFKLKHEIDTGSILLQEKISIGENTTAGELHDVLMLKGAEILLKSVQLIESGKFELKEQASADKIKHAPKIYKDTCRIEWNKNADPIHNFIRGLSPYPGAWTEMQTNSERTQIKIFRTQKTGDNKNKTAGTIEVEGTRLRVYCGENSLWIEEVQAAGRKRMSAAEFLRGTKLLSETKFI
jgi:methionyl-tRNA formyltransferase